MNKIVICFILYVCVSFQTIKAEESWPGFLGQGGSTLPAESMPLKWSPTENIKWQKALPGHGQSSPVIWGKKVYVTQVEGSLKEQLHLICLSLETGDIEWQVKRVSSNQEQNSVYISRAAPTPVVDEKGVYAYFEGGDLLACDHQGKLLWEKSISDLYGKPVNKFGLSASLAQYENKIYVLVDDEGPSYVAAFEKSKGELVWKKDRKSRVSWSSPMVLTLNKVPQLVISSAGSIESYDLENGDLKWKYEDIAGNTGTSPLSAGENMFLVGASPGREGQNAEGAKKSNGLYQLDQAEGKPVIKKLWFTEEAVPSWASPIAHQGLVYWINRSGVIYCFDLKTGEKLYAQRLPQSSWATPVAIGQQIYIFGKDGMTSVIAGGKEYKMLAENQLWDPAKPPIDDSLVGVEETDPQRRAGLSMFNKTTLYGVAAVPGKFVLRTGTMLYCVGK